MISVEHKILAVSTNCHLLREWLRQGAPVMEYETCLLTFTHFFRGSALSFDNLIFQEWLETSLMNLVELCMTKSPQCLEYLECIITSLDRALIQQ